MKRIVLIVAVALALAPPRVFAQAVVNTVVGSPEVIAIAVDHASGTTYFATDRPGAIYRIPVNGSPSLLAGVAGGRTDDGAAAGQSAVFPGHNGLAVDAGGNVYFSEPSLHRIRQIDGTGTITTIAGSGSVSQVNPRNIFGGFSIHTDLPAPTALAFNPVTGDLFAADETWDIVVQITANGATLSRSTARTFLAIGGDPNSASIFLDFYWYNAFGYSGDGGAAIDAKLNHPRGLAFDALGNLFIADTGNHVVRRVDTSGTITTFAGSGTPGSSGDGGAAANARLFMPTGVFVTAAGDLAIADTSNHRVRLVDFHSGVISTVAGTGSAGHAGDNSAATAATLAYPLGVAQTVSGALLIADSQNNRVRSVSQSVITTLAQTGTDYSGNGAPGGNAVNQPLGVGFDKSGNLFFTDTGNARVRRVDAATRAVTTVVGSGVPGYGGDGGPAVNAMLNCPTALTFDKNGVLFVADGCANTVRRVVPGVDGLVTGAADEIITTYAGTGARYGAGDGAFGPATAARLANPAGLAIDSTGTLYIGELDAFEIRTVDSGGTISGQMGELFPTGLVIDPKYDALIVANGEESDLECGGYQIVRQGNIGLPVGAGGSALDALARLYLSDDRSLQSVYRLTFTGGDICDGTQEGLQVSFVAGTGQGVIGYSGDGGLATAATFNSPEGVAIDPAGNLVVADAGNNVIRRVQQPSVIVGVDVSSIDFGIRGLLAASPSTVVTATATGSAAATFTAATLSGANPGDFIITSDGCVGAVVAVGATCQVKVSFRPTALGPRTATLQINDNASGAPQLVSLTGVGASLTVAPLTISFASQTVGIASAPTSVTVTNGTATTTTVLSLGFSGANANDFATLSDTCTGTVLTAQMSCTFGVTFAPQDVGPRAATLNVSSTAADSPQAIGLSGTGIPAFPAVQLAPASIAFPATTVGSTSTNVALTVNSTGTAPLVLNSLTLSGNQASDFTIAGGTCVVPQSIAPGQSCTALITFAPQAACNSTASLSVADNAPGSPQTVALTGLGLNSPEAPFTTALFCTSHAAQPHEMAAAPDGRVWFDEGGSAFAPPALANVSATQGVKENPAAIDPSDKITGLAFAPDSSHAYLESQLNVGNWVSLVNPAGVKVKSPTAFPFSVIAGPDYGLWEAHDYSCGDSALATDFSPNGKTSDYTPTAAWIYANASQHFCVNTSSIAPGPDGTMWFGITASSGGVNATHATSPNGFIRVAPDGTFVDFTPDVQTTSTALGSDGNFYALFQTIGACNIEKIDAAGNRTTITLDYNVAVPNCQTIVAGPDKRLWMVGNTPGFVSALIAWDPATGAISTYPAPATLYLTAGPDEGIWFDALPSAVGRLDIGGGPSRGFLMPQIVSFQGPTGGATSAAKTVTLYSTGTAPLDITSVTVGGAEPAQFVIQDDCGGKSIAPGASCTVVVASRSTKPGNHLATLVINDNDVFSPQTVPLTEFTNPPSPSVAPPSLSFPTTNVGQQSASAKLTLLNPTDRLLAVNFVSIDGTNGNDFKKITDTCSTTSVPPGGTCTVTISFAPTATGTRTAIVTFNDAANPPTQTVSLTGGGSAASTGGGGTTSGTCACSKTGLFVDPAVVTPANTVTSPNGLFTLTVTPPGIGTPTVLTITSATKMVATFSVADAAFPVTPPTASPENVAWGFSPDGNGFAVHFESTSTQSDNIWLYDLTQPSNNPVWKSDSIPLNPAPGGTAAGPAGSIAFSPHGNYLIATQLQTDSATSEQHVFLAVVSSKGVRVLPDDWVPSAAPGGSDISGGADTKAGSAFWGFSPDDRSFVYVKRFNDGTSTLEMWNLSTPSKVQSLPFDPASALASYVQFSPCGDVLAVLEQQTSSTTGNPVSLTLYETAAAAAPIVARSGLPTGTATLNATPTEFDVTFDDWTGNPFVAANTAAAGCAPPTTTGDAGGSAALQAPVFDPKIQTPTNLVVGGQSYTITFTATGSPTPTFGLNSGDVLPVWVSIDPYSGELSITPPLDITPVAFTFTVVATNPGDVTKSAALGPFTISVTPPSAPVPANDGGSGPYTPDNDAAAFEPAAPLPAPAVFEEMQSGSQTPSAATTLLLPNGRGQIQLPSDVTPALSTFTYTETDTPSAPIGPLGFLGLDFTLNAIDAVSSATVLSLTDSPFATITLQDSDLKSARIRDLSTLGLYWWSGTAWVNQLPCAGCSIDANALTLSVSLRHVGEYMLAAVVPPPPVLTIMPVAIHAVAGVSITAVVASFVPASPLDTLSQYFALIAWGDGQVSAAAFGSNSSGTFIVSGTHTWAASGNYPVTVTVFSGNASWTGQATAVVAPTSAPPQFTAAAPPLTAIVGSPYTYAFAASGVPAPTFALASGAPAWLSIGPNSGLVSGTPPSGTTSFVYSVAAANGVSPNATAGPFTVTVSTTTKPSADVAVTISGPATATKGSTVTYTVVLSNNGPSSATNALVVVGVGPNTSFVSAVPNPQVNLPELWTWSVPTVAAGHSTTFTLKVKVTRAGTVIAATAAGSETRDPKLTNNVATLQTIVK